MIFQIFFLSSCEVRSVYFFMSIIGEFNFKISNNSCVFVFFQTKGRLITNVHSGRVTYDIRILRGKISPCAFFCVPVQPGRGEMGSLQDESHLMISEMTNLTG